MLFYGVREERRVKRLGKEDWRGAVGGCRMPPESTPVMRMKGSDRWRVRHFLYGRGE